MANTRKTQRNALSQGDEPMKLSQSQENNTSPELQVPKRRRKAFGDITNAHNQNITTKGGKKAEKKSKVTTKKKTRRVKPTESQSDSAETLSAWEITLSQEVRSSQESVASQGSESGSQTSVSSQESEAAGDKSMREDPMQTEQEWEDIDTENMNDPFQVGRYAFDIFEYYKERETKFELSAFMDKQPDLTANMRAILVDWLVEVQENFELNHETLYLAVKLVDHYLDRVRISKEKLQLVGATAMFIACKFDERCPPVIDDFKYICDDAYSREELLRMEQNILKTIGFDIGMPLSYRFLRRYSKCCRASTETLTFARYILETSLMDYSYVTHRDSQVAAACLLLALRTKDVGQWDATLVHYTGYQQEELAPLCLRLNTMITTPPNQQLQTIHAKYSHTVFHEVAKIPTLDNGTLSSQLRSTSLKAS